MNNQIAETRSESKMDMAERRFKEVRNDCIRRFGEGNFYFMNGPGILLMMEKEEIETCLPDTVEGMLGLRRL